MIEEITKDWQWLSFLAQYCAGRNIGKTFCDDVRWWALGIAALIIVLVAWWILSKIARAYENWNHRRLFAKIADAQTMKKHVWSGHDAHLPSSDQRANRRSEK
jgi:ABC-type nickel/cobalt efflux system permease component RcnA